MLVVRGMQIVEALPISALFRLLLSTLLYSLLNILLYLTNVFTLNIIEHIKRKNLK